MGNIFKNFKTLPERVDHLGTFGIAFSTKYKLGHTNLLNYLYRPYMNCEGASADGRWNCRSRDCVIAASCSVSLDPYRGLFYFNELSLVSEHAVVNVRS